MKQKTAYFLVGGGFVGVMAEDFLIGIPDRIEAVSRSDPYILCFIFGDCQDMAVAECCRIAYFVSIHLELVSVILIDPISRSQP